MNRNVFVIPPILLGITILLTFSPAFSLARTLTLKDAIRIALEQNRTILQAREKVNIAQSQVVQARSAYLPKIEAKGIYAPSFLEKIPEPPFDFSQIIPEEFREVLESKRGEFEFDLTYDYSLELNAVQPLFTGGKIWHANQQARLNLLIAREKLRQVRNETILSVIRAFDGVILAREFVKVAQEAVTLAEEQLRVTQARYRSGEALEFEVLRAQVELSNLKPRLIEAKNQLELALLGLKNFLGIDLNEEIEVEGDLAFSEITLSREQCIQTALRERPEITQLAYQREIGQHLLKTARAGYYPSLSVAFRYTQQSNPEWDWTEGYAGFLILSVPISNGFYTHGKIKEAKALLTSISIGFSQLKEGIKLEVEQAYLKVLEAREIVEATREAVRQAERSVEIARDQYAAGLINGLQMMGARLGLTRARTNHLKALHNLITAQASLEKAMGIIKSESWGAKKIGQGSALR